MSKHGKLIGHEPCPKCGSKDNVERREDGYAKCYSCDFYEYTKVTEETARKMPNRELMQGSCQPLIKRGISLETVQKWNYQVGTLSGGDACQIANYYDSTGNLIAQKVRTPDKKFFCTGDFNSVGLYGQWLWSANHAKRIVVTEGEIDALSISELQDNRWPVVSIPTGAGGASHSVRNNIEYLESFDEVVFCFDSDEPGRKAARECAELLSPGKARIAVLNMKDPNEMLVSGKAKELMAAIYSAKVFRPDGILSGEQLWEVITTEVVESDLRYPWACLNELTHGLRKYEMVTICAGTGIGKTTLVKEIEYALIQQGEIVGHVGLEEQPRPTALSLIGIHLSKNLRVYPLSATQEEKREAFEAIMGNGRLHVYDHTGSRDLETILAKIRYMVRALGCTFIVLDHVSIMVSGVSDGDERRIIDNIMTQLRSLVDELGIGMIVVSHLKRPSGDLGHEDGAQTHMSQLRGSAAIGQLSDMVIGLERCQQGEDISGDSVDPNTVLLRILKNRFTGETGPSGYLRYLVDTGRLLETTFSKEIFS